MDIQSVLTQVPLLSGLNAKVRRRLSEQGKRRVYGRGEYIIRQGDPASALYIVLRGRVEVEQEEEGTVEILRELVPYAFFGEVALIENTLRTASVKALDETECLPLQTWEFTALLKEYPDMADVVLHELIGRLHRKEHQVL
jgi:CRP-like cAMP-binding protein